MFTGRWFAGPDGQHRLVHDDMVWDIEGLAELGRRVALEVTATAVRYKMAVLDSSPALLALLKALGAPKHVVEFHLIARADAAVEVQMTYLPGCTWKRLPSGFGLSRSTTATTMPTAEDALFSILTTGSPNPVATIVGTESILTCFHRIRHFQLSAISASQRRDNTAPMDGLAGYAEPRFQIDCYDLKRSSANALAQAVYGLLEGYTGTANGLQVGHISAEDERGDIEPDAGPDGKDLYRQGVDVFLAHPE